MANYVKVSCVGPAPLSIGDVPPQQAVDNMVDHWRRQVQQVLTEKPDMVVLPEACDRPSGIWREKQKLREFYRHRGDRVRNMLAELAIEFNCQFVYAAHIQEPDGTWRNAQQIIGRDGRIVGQYFKNHLVFEENTVNDIAYGTEAPIIECDFGKVVGAICFDLNFHELREQYVAAKPDLIVFSSMYHGGLMQNMWALTCRSYFAGSIAGTPPSTIVSPLGEVIASSTNYYNHVTATINLDYKVIGLGRHFKHFEQIRQKYGSKVRIHEPGHLALALMTSETDEWTTEDIVREFGMELVDDYFSRALAVRQEVIRQQGR